jgi:GNAT superfamily N-acetyltransferase
MMEHTLRIATQNDIPRLVQLLTVLFSQEAELQPNEDAQHRGLQMIIADSRIGHILVLEHSDKIIGMIGVIYSVSTALGARVAWIEDVVIDPAHRGGGLGKKLVSGALDFAQKQGCARVMLLTDHDNLHAQKLYESQGFFRSTMVPFKRVF